MQSIKDERTDIDSGTTSSLLKKEDSVLKSADRVQTKLSFPWKLHRLLEDAEKEGNMHIVSWLPDGKAFKIHKPKEFCKTTIAKYFKQTKLESFTRQVRSKASILRKRNRRMCKC
jgi:hypothetical protein